MAPTDLSGARNLGAAARAMQADGDPGAAERAARRALAGAARTLTRQPATPSAATAQGRGPERAAA